MELRERVRGVRPELDDPLLRRALANLTATVSAKRLRRVGRYHLIRRLGGGGFGTVWLARDPLLSRQVAIKILHRDLGGEQLWHLRREAQTLASLSHPNVVACFDVGVDLDTPYMALQYVDGCDLAAWLAEPRSPRDVLRVFAEAAAGLAAAHAMGIVHRDVKPANILLARQGPAMVTDFGVARAWCDATTPSDGESPITSIAGTPIYMPPEQMMGRPATPAFDVYALAATLYEALAGAHPFGGSTHAELLERKLASRINLPARGRSVSSRVWDAVVAGLDPDPRRRPSALELVHGASPRASRVSRAVVALGVAVPLFAFATTPTHRDPCDVPAATGSSERLTEDIGAAVQGRRSELEEARAAACGGFADGELARNELDARLECLEQDGSDLSALVDALESSKVVGADALMALAGLPASGRCAAEAPTEVGHDPEAARARLMLARAIRGRDAAAAYAEATAVLAIAEADGRTALQAEALVQRGIASFAHLEGAPAIADLRHAFWLASSHGDDRLAAEAAVWLVGVVGRIDGPAEAEPWARHAEAALDRLIDADSLRAWLELHRSANALAAGDLAQAAIAGDRMLAYWKRTAADDGEALVHPWLQYAAILRSSGRLDDALAAVEQARRRIVPKRDRGGSLALHARTIAASVRFDQGDVEGALTEFRAVLPRLDAALGSADARVVATRTNLARLLAVSGRHAEAREHQKILLEQAERSLGRDHERVATVLADLGFLELRAGELELAREHLLRAAVIFEGRPMSPRSVSVYTALADVDAASEDQEGALKWMERAQAVADETHPLGHPQRLEIAARGAVARATARGESADFARLAALRRGLANPRQRADLAMGASIAYRRHGDFVSGEQADREALAYFEEHGSRGELARAWYSLANSLEGLGRDDKAVSKLRREACAALREPAWFDRFYDRECTKLGIARL